MGKKVITIAFANNKGGSGKTTTCANIGYSLALMGRKVLLIDGDMQMNLTLSFFEEEKVLEFASGERNIYYGVKKQDDLTGYIKKSFCEELDLIPSTILMSGIEYELFTRWQRELILRKCLQEIKSSGEYDYILIDAPPTLGSWVMNILCASDYVVMPVEASPWGLFGVANMFEFLEDVRQINGELALLGIAITKVDARKNYYKQTLEAFRKEENLRVFEQVIRVDSEIEWSQDRSRPVAAHKKSARSAAEYMELAKEIEAYAGRNRKH